MKTIIAGSREWSCEFTCTMTMSKLRSEGWIITEVVSGTARGADKVGEGWANINDIPITRMPADWDRFGSIAGRRRNLEMAEYADSLVAFWNGISPGTRNMIDLAKARGLKVHIEMV